MSDDEKVDPADFVGPLDFHRPKTGQGRDKVVCSECARWEGQRLKRAKWPCRTAVALGVPEGDDGTAYRR